MIYLYSERGPDPSPAMTIRTLRNRAVQGPLRRRQRIEHEAMRAAQPLCVLVLVLVELLEHRAVRGDRLWQLVDLAWSTAHDSRSGSTRGPGGSLAPAGGRRQARRMLAAAPLAPRGERRQPARCSERADPGAPARAQLLPLGACFTRTFPLVLAKNNSGTLIRAARVQPHHSGGSAAGPIERYKSQGGILAPSQGGILAP